MNHLVLEVGLALGLIALASLISHKLPSRSFLFSSLSELQWAHTSLRIGPLDFRFIESAEPIEFMGRVGILFLLF